VIGLLLLASSVGVQLFTREVAESLSKLPLACISKDFSKTAGHRSDAADDQVLVPSGLHFSVQGHKMLVKLLQVYPDLKNREEIIKGQHAHLQPTNVLTESVCFWYHKVV
jgi:hypothetical protein